MPKMQNQKYLMKIDLGGGNYRYLYTQEEVAAYKAGKTGGNQSHGEDHYQYQTNDRTRTEGVTTGRQTNVRNNRGNIVRTTDRKHYVGSGQLIRGRRQIPDSGNSNQINYRYQTSRNGKTEVRTGTGSVERTIPGDPVAKRKAAEQLKNAPQNHGGASSSRGYRYVRSHKVTGKYETNNSKNPITRLKNNVKGNTVKVDTETSYGRGDIAKGYIGDRRDTHYEDNKTTKKIKGAKKAIKSAPAKAKAAGKSIAKGYDNATTKMADKALKATPKIKKTAKNIAKNYDNATTKIADKAWDATHSKTAQKAKKTVSSGAKKASNALTKAWNNLFKKKKK